MRHDSRAGVPVLLGPVGLSRVAPVLTAAQRPVQAGAPSGAGVATCLRAVAATPRPRTWAPDALGALEGARKEPGEVRAHPNAGNNASD